jgi:hypothetical protein
MRLPRAFSMISFTILLVAGGVSAALCQRSAETAAHIISSTPDVAVGWCGAASRLNLKK